MVIQVEAEHRALVHKIYSSRFVDPIDCAIARPSHITKGDRCSSHNRKSKSTLDQ